MLPGCSPRAGRSIVIRVAGLAAARHALATRPARVRSRPPSIRIRCTVYSVLPLNVCRYAVRDEMPYDESIDRTTLNRLRKNGFGTSVSARATAAHPATAVLKYKDTYIAIIKLITRCAVCCTACTGFTSFAHLLSLRYSQETNVRMSTAAHKDVPVGETRRQSAECAPREDAIQ